MSRFRMTSLTLSLGLLATAAYADEGPWGPPPPRPNPAPAAAAAQLGRPIAVTPAGPADSQVQHASFAPVIRAQAPDAKPMPPGPGAGNDPTPTPEPAPAPRDWQRPNPAQPLPAPTPMMDAGPAPEPVSDCDGCCRRIWSWLHLGCCRSQSDAVDAGCDAGCNAGCCDAGCNAGCCDAGCNAGCCDNSRFYARGEYLLWWTKGDPLPPLVTAGSLSDLQTPGVNSGALDRPGTQILFGNSEANDRLRSGGRVMVGYWFGDDHCFGLEGGGFELANQSTNFSDFSGGVPLLFRPIFNVLTNRQDAEVIAEPGSGRLEPAAGMVTASDVNSFWGAEANFRTNLCCGPCYNVDLIAGWRYLGLDDTLTVAEAIQGFGATGPNFAFTGVDQFKAQNRFNGGQVGFDGEWRWNRWSLDARALVAVGDVTERVTIQGFNTQNGVTTSGDLLTVPGPGGNIGIHHRNNFAWSPEGNLKLGYQFTDHMRALVGYDFLYLSDVARAGSQVNLAVDRTHLGGGATTSAQPPFVFQQSDFWAQGLNFGLEFRY